MSNHIFLHVSVQYFHSRLFLKNTEFWGLQKVMVAETTWERFESCKAASSAVLSTWTEGSDITVQNANWPQICH